jgi:DNA-binding NarL/FixJ family response regulator
LGHPGIRPANPPRNSCFGGNANQEIAAQLSITEKTVKGHINILAKLGANDPTHAVTIGLKRGIIDL